MQTGEWKPKDKRYSNIGDLIQKYLKKVTPQKKGAEPETRRLKRLLKEKSLMAINLDEAKPHHFAGFGDKRLQDGNRAAQYDFCLTCMEHRTDWMGLAPERKPRQPYSSTRNNPARERRLRTGEYEALREAAVTRSYLANYWYRNRNSYAAWWNSQPAMEISILTNNAPTPSN